MKRVAFTSVMTAICSTALAAEIHDYQSFSTPSKKTVGEVQDALMQHMPQCELLAKCDPPRPDGTATCTVWAHSASARVGKVELIPTGSNSLVIVSVQKEYPQPYRERQIRLWLHVIEGRVDAACPKAPRKEG